MKSVAAEMKENESINQVGEGAMAERKYNVA
jgi:hypothetical protein